MSREKRRTQIHLDQSLSREIQNVRQIVSDHGKRFARIAKLVNEGADIHGRHCGRVTPPLPAAVMSGDTATTTWLLEKGCDPNQADKGQAPLVIACTRSNVEMAVILLSFGAKPYPEQSGETVDLGGSILHGIGTPGEKSALLSALIEHGYDPTKPNRHGATAIDIANKLGEIGLKDMMEHKLQEAGEARLMKDAPSASNRTTTDHSL